MYRLVDNRDNELVEDFEKYSKADRYLKELIHGTVIYLNGTNYESYDYDSEYASIEACYRIDELRG